MKRISTLLLLLATIGIVSAQAPSGFNYQAALRNTSGQPLVNQAVSMRFTIRDGSPSGTVLYQETQSKTTSSSGIVAAIVGTGTVVSGAYPTATQLASGAKYLQVEMDPAGGSSYADLGTSQIVSVPYANYANTAGAANNFNGNINPSQITGSGAASGQVLKWNGTQWTPQNDVGGGTGDNWGTQTVVTDGTLSGNGTTGNALKLAQNGAGSGQVMKWNGTAWAPANESFTAVSTDATLSGNGTSGNVLKLAQNGATNGKVLKWNGSAWVPSNETVTTAGTGVTISGGVINTPWSINGNSIYNNNSGGVGIGTNSPLSQFHLKGGGQMGRMEFSSTSTWGDWFGFYNKSRYIGYIGNYNDTSGLDFGTSGTGTKVNLVTSAQPRLTVAANGNVGIGTTTPTELLDVYGSGNTRIRVKSTSSNAAGSIDLENESNQIFSIFKGGTSTGSSFYGWNTSKMALLNNTSTGSMVLATVDSIGFVSGGAMRMRLSKAGDLVVGDPVGRNSAYVTIAAATYSSAKPNLELVGPGAAMAFRDFSGTWQSGLQFFNGVMNIKTLGSYPMALGTNYGNDIYINTTGRVGINNSAPRYALDVAGKSGQRIALYTSSSEQGSADSGTLTVKNNYNSSSFSYAITASTTGSLGYAGYLKSKYCGIRADATSGSGIGYGGYFYADNSSTSNFGATGYTAGSGSVNYGVYGLASGGTTNYAMYCSGNGVYTGTWSSSSDAKLKQNISNLSPGLAAVMKLRPTEYEFQANNPEFKSMNLATGLHYGFIAQELEQVLPGLVQQNVHTSPENPDHKIEYKSVNYTEMIPVLTKAIQEQQNLIEELRKRNEALENRVKQLEK